MTDLSDTAYKKDGGYCHSRYLYHVRCIRFIESFINNGIVDFSITQPLPPKELKSKEFRSLRLAISLYLWYWYARNIIRRQASVRI